MPATSAVFLKDVTTRFLSLDEGGAGPTAPWCLLAARSDGWVRVLKDRSVYWPGPIVPTTVPPLSTSVMIPEAAADSMASSDVSGCPCTVLANAPPKGVEVTPGAHRSLAMP